MREREEKKKLSFLYSLTCGSCLRAKGPRDSLQQLGRLSVLVGWSRRREREKEKKGENEKGGGRRWFFFFPFPPQSLSPARCFASSSSPLSPSHEVGWGIRRRTRSWTRAREALRAERRNRTGTLKQKKRGGELNGPSLLHASLHVFFVPLRLLTALLPLWSSSDMKTRHEEEEESEWRSEG